MHRMNWQNISVRMLLMASAVWLQGPPTAHADLAPGPPYDACNKRPQGSACEEYGVPGICLPDGQGVWSMGICIVPAVFACGKMTPTGKKIEAPRRYMLDPVDPGKIDEVLFREVPVGTACTLEGHSGRCESVTSSSLLSRDTIACVTHPERDHDEAETTKRAFWQASRQASMRRSGSVLAAGIVSLALCAYWWRGGKR